MRDRVGAVHMWVYVWVGDGVGAVHMWLYAWVEDWVGAGSRVGACGCTYMWRPEVRLRCCSLGAAHFGEVGGFFSQTNQFSEAGWPVSQRDPLPVSTSPALGL